METLNETVPIPMVSGVIHEDMTGPSERIESFDETINRFIQTGVHLIDGSDPMHLQQDFIYTRQKGNWVIDFRRKSEDRIDIDPKLPENSEITEEAVVALNNDEETLAMIARNIRWWEGNRTKDVSSRLNDGLVISNPEAGQEQTITVLNATKEVLDTRTQQNILSAVNAVANFSGGAVFGRVRGIVLSEEDQFRDGEAGTFGPFDRVLRINIGLIRREALIKKPEDSRYYTYLPDVDFEQVVLAHELGHAMDIASIDEAERADIDATGKVHFGINGKTCDISIFEDSFGWQSEITDKGDGTSEKTWTRSDDRSEKPPTNYAESNAREDFAETFALMALGADRERFPKRAKTLADGIQKVYQNRTHGPFKLESRYISDRDKLEINIPKLNVQLCVEG